MVLRSPSKALSSVLWLLSAASRLLVRRSIFFSKVALSR